MYCILLTLMFAILDNYVEFDFISLYLIFESLTLFLEKIHLHI